MATHAPHGLTYQLRGAGETIVFLHALGTSSHLWDGLPPPGAPWRLLAPDMRGHGDCAPAADGNYAFDRLAADVVQLLDLHGIARAPVVGISVGGEIAQVLAALHPERVERLLLVSTACVTHADRARLWSERIARAASAGMPAVAAEAVRRWFTVPFQQTHPEAVGKWERIVAQTSLAGYIGIARTIERMDLRPLLGKIRCPTWVLSGALDAATGLTAGEEIARGIPGAIHRVIDEAGHLWNLESPSLFGRELESWLQATSLTV